MLGYLSAALGAAASASVAGWMATAARSDAHRRADVVVVLGARATGGRPSTALQRRIDVAAEVLLARPELGVVACGGRGPGESLSEAAVIGRELVARGVDRARIALEERSTTTAENLAFALPHIRALARSERPRVLIATSDFHLARSRLLARALDLTPLSLPASTPRSRLPRACAREVAALAKACAVDLRWLRSRR